MLSPTHIVLPLVILLALSWSVQSGCRSWVMAWAGPSRNSASHHRPPWTRSIGEELGDLHPDHGRGQGQRTQPSRRIRRSCGGD